MTLVAPDARCSATLPRESFGVSHAETDDTIRWAVHSSSLEVAENAERLAKLRARLSQRGQHLPVSLVHDVNVGDSDSDSDSPPSGSSSEGPASAHSSQTAAAYHPAGLYRSVGAKLPPFRIAFKEVGVGGAPVCLERWYPTLPPAPIVASAPHEPTIVDYLELSKPYDVDRLAREYENKAPMDSPMATPRSRRSVHLGGNSFEAQLQFGRRATRTGPLSPGGPETKLQLLKNAPWEKRKAPSPALAAAPPPAPPPPEPEADLRLSNKDLSADDVPALISRIERNAGLMSVDLSFNPKLCDEGVVELVPALLRHQGIRSIDLRGTCMGDAGALALSDYLAESQVTELDLRWNGVSKEGSWHLKKAIDRSPTVQVIRLTDERQSYVVHRPQDEDGDLLSDGIIGLKVNQNACILAVYANTPAAVAVLEEVHDGYDPPDDAFPTLIPGMVVREVNGKKVRTDIQLREYLRKSDTAQLVVTVQSNRVPKKTAARIEKKLRNKWADDEEEEGEEE
eukprot:gene13526-20831_t